MHRVALLLLLIGQISADCLQQKALEARMDSVEKHVDQAVDLLESEVALLLQTLDQSPLLDTPETYILEEPPATHT